MNDLTNIDIRQEILHNIPIDLVTINGIDFQMLYILCKQRTAFRSISESSFRIFLSQLIESKKVYQLENGNYVQPDSHDAREIIKTKRGETVMENNENKIAAENSSIEWEKEALNLDESPVEWFSPASGLYEVELKSDGIQKTYPEGKYGPYSKVFFDVIVSNKKYRWGITKSENPTISSLYGQVLYLIKHEGKGKAQGLKFTLLVKEKPGSDGKLKRDFTITQVQSLLQKQREATPSF